MERNYFDDELDRLLASFSITRHFSDQQKAAIFDSVLEYPNEFMRWGVGRIVDTQDDLPRNLPKFLRALYLEWVREQPSEQKGPVGMEQDGDPRCPECGGTGWFHAWKMAGPASAPTAIRCICNANPADEERVFGPAATRDLLDRNGWTLKNPWQERDDWSKGRTMPAHPALTA